MGGLTTPKGGATQTTTAKQEVPAYVQSAQQNLLNASNSVLTPFIQQQAYTQAGVNPDQMAGYDLTRSLAQGAFTRPSTSTPGAYTAPTQSAQAPGLLDYRTQPNGQASYAPTGYTAQGYSPALASTSTYDPSLATAAQVTGKEIQSFLNPYTQSVVDTTNANMRRQYETTAANLGAKAAAAGAFGGSGAALASGQLARSFGEQVASTTATLMSAGYDKATATALANAGMRQQTELANQGAKNNAGQFNANATNTTSQFNASAQNTAGQFLAGATNTALGSNAAATNTSAQFNATQGANQLQNYNATELQKYQLDLSRDQNLANNALTARGQDANIAQLQEAIRSGDQNRQLAAINALLGIGDAQQKMVQAGVSTPLQYLQLLAQATPGNYGSTTTSTAPNTAPSPLQSLISGIGSVATAPLSGGSTLFGKAVSGLGF